VPLDKDCNFLVKLVVMERTDAHGATLTRVKVQKLPMPLNLATMYGDTNFDESRQLPTHLTTVKIARANPVATLREKNSAFNEYAKKANALPQTAVPESKVDLGYAQLVEDSKGLTLHRKLGGRIFNYYEKLKIDPLIVKDLSTEIPRKVVNKVILNFMASPKVDKALITSNVGYIVNACPGIDVYNEAIPALAYAVKDTVAVEGLLTQLAASKDVDLLKAFKNNSIEVTPTSIKQAFGSRKLLTYLSLKFRDFFGLNQETVVNTGAESVGTAIDPFQSSH